MQFSAEKSDLGQSMRNLTSVPVDLVKGRPDIRNPEMVWQKIGRFPDYLIFLGFYGLGVFRKIVQFQQGTME